MSKFIKQKNAMIVWDVDDEDFIIDFHVYEYTNEQRNQGLGNPRFQHCSYSHGNCYFDWWNSLSKPDLICECIRILFDYKPKNLKYCLLELGKIEELESIRKMTYDLFERSSDIYFEEFVDKYY